MASDRASDAVREYLSDLALGLVPLGAVAAATWRLMGLPATYHLGVAGLYAATGALLVSGAARGFGGASMGPANRVTLLRATIVLPIAALGFLPGALAAERAAWWVIVTSTVAMILDGVDGHVARRTGSGSRLGARFDMELDAFFLLALSWLVWQSGKAGPWVLGLGALRYVFVAAGALSPRLRGDLPESFRRKAACVVSGVALLVSLGPTVPAPLAVLAAALGLALLVYSFGVDVVWLLARPANREPSEGQ